MACKETLVETLVKLGGGARIARAGQPVQAFAWARVSTEEQERQGFSIEQQLREIRVYAEQLGIDIVQEFHEAASAHQREHHRLVFHQMLEEAKARPEITTIVVHDLSRFSRDTLIALKLRQELRDAGIEIVSVMDPSTDPDVPVSILIDLITLGKNELFSREIAMHTRKGCRANIQARDPDSGHCFKNGGQPLWGYVAKRVMFGGNGSDAKRKTIWVLDETIVKGRPVHEWVRHCLVELAAKGASLAELRDFCNDAGLPGRRKPYWQITTWNALLKPSVMLQYCGYAVWNVHTKKGRVRDSSEWIIVENGHPAIITEEETKQIAEARQKQRRNPRARRFDTGCGRSRYSRYLLSGGLIKCDRCGANMMGLRINGGYEYYVCGSHPYRKGKGCGRPAVYVPKQFIEDEVIKGIGDLTRVCTDTDRLTRLVNQKIRSIMKQRTEESRDVAEKLQALGDKIKNIHRAIEDGLADTVWANDRLGQLEEEKGRLERLTGVPSKPPQLDRETVERYLGELRRLLEVAKPAERKKLIRTLVQEVRLAPEKREVVITYRLPEPVFMQARVAGTGFEPVTFGL